MRLRFFAEAGVEHCVWSDDDDPDATMRRLPIPTGLAARMSAWAHEYTTRTLWNDPHPWTPATRAAFDRRGLELSRELQAELGDTYLVEYKPLTSEVAEVLQAGDWEPESVHPARLAELVRAVAFVALPAAQQLGLLAQRGEDDQPDSFLTDIFEGSRHLDYLEEVGWISRRTAVAVRSLERHLQQIGPADARGPRSASVLATDPGWQEARALAAEVLAAI